MEDVYQHFRKEEQPFIDNINDWVAQVENQYTPYLTNFLDPRQQFILEAIVGQNSDIRLHYFGGYEAAERKRAFLSPPYFEPSQDEYEIGLCEIRYPIRFAQLSHGKILGTLLSSGLKRELFGDIISDGERWQFFVERSLIDFIQSQVDRVGKAKVTIEEQDYTEILLPKDSWTIQTETVSSMRLDTVIAAVFNLSRQRAKEAIQAQKVKVNWTVMDRPDFELGILDVVSVRKRGRLQVKNILGMSKKGKIRLELGVLDRNQ